MFWELHQIQLVIHYDPVMKDDEELNEVRDILLQTLSRIDERLSAHDFRIVRGQEHSNLIFDVVIPYDMDREKENVKDALNHAAQEVNSKYRLVITFDSHGFNQM
jgi:hypothetical protein